MLRHSLMLTCSVSAFALLLGSATAENVKTKDTLQLQMLQENITRTPVQDYRKLQSIIIKQQEQLQIQSEELRQQKRLLHSLESQLDGFLDTQRATGLEGTRPSKEDMQEVAAQKDTENNVAPSTSGSAQSAQGGNSMPDVVGTERRPEPKEHPPAVPALEDEGGVLLRKGKLVIEPSIEYSHSSALRVAVEGFTIIPAINIGSFDITDVSRDTITKAISARLGITNKFELAARVPFVYRNDSTISRPFGVGANSDVLTDVDGYGLGDVEVSGHYHINDGKNGWPFFIANMRFKSTTGTDPFEVPVDPDTQLQMELPTGSGFYALQPSMTVIFPSDPVVFFGNLGYLYNMKRDIGGSVGEIDPGDSINASFGMGFSVNEKASFSLGYSHDTVFKTEQNGVEVANSTLLQVGALNTGFAYRLSDSTNINLSFSAGMTDDAPDSRVSVRVPITLDLF